MEHRKKKRLAGALSAGAFFAMVLLAVITEPPRIVFALLCAALLHEAGHVLAMLLCGIKPSGMGILPFGIIIRADMQGIGYLSEFFIYISGPAASFLGAAAVMRINENAIDLVLLSAGLGAFNIIPLPGLDGAGALEALLFRYLPYRAAYTVSRAAEGVLSLLFLCACAYIYTVYKLAAYPLLLSVFFMIRFLSGGVKF